MARYTRDEILEQGLELASSPTLTQHDMPGGVIEPNAHCIKWLQNALDMFHRKYPFSGDLSNTLLSIGIGSTDAVLSSDNTKFLPDDFILDVRNGILVNFNNQMYRLQRKSFQYWLSYSLTTQNQQVPQPRVYAIVDERIKIAPLLSQAYSCTFWYYALPAKLTAKSQPKFPDEWSLIEFIRLKALEWTRSIDPGVAQAYLQKQLAGFRAAGLLNEPEYEDAIPLENNQVFPDGTLINRNAWMGGIAL